MNSYLQSKIINIANDSKLLSKPLIILGGGGHAKVLIDCLRYYNCNIVGITDPNQDKYNTNIMDVEIIGTDAEVFSYSPDKILLINAVGSTSDTVKRKALFESFKAKGYSFSQALHISSVISPEVKLGEGVQVMAGSVIQPGCVIGNNTIVNTKASVDHDCRIGNNVHIAPGVTISGNVLIGDNVHIGCGTSVIQDVHIGRNSVIGAGALVLKNIPDNTTVYGVPAKVVSR